MNITVVIPTKNRPDDLLQAVHSILAQTRKPNELLVIDQGHEDTSERAVRKILLRNHDLTLNYIRDPLIAGLVPAKVESLQHAKGDLICFLEDDVFLEVDYLAEIEAGFLRHPTMLGCCGLITELAPMPSGYLFFFHLFHRGIFNDPRVGVHGNCHGKNLPVIPSAALSGGVSAWRKCVFEMVQFDVKNDFFMLEDIEFSTRAAQLLGAHFYINPNARLDHRYSPLNRAGLSARQQRKIREYIVFYKKHRYKHWALTSLIWLLIGLLIESFFQSVRQRSPGLIWNYFAGVFEGIAWELR